MIPYCKCFKLEFPTQLLLCIHNISDCLFPGFRRDIAVVQIFYAEKFFREQFREELIGFTDFLCKYSHNWNTYTQRLAIAFLAVIDTLMIVLGKFAIHIYAENAKSSIHRI